MNIRRGRSNSHLALRNHKNRQGLVLLVVLGMLGLFSLLAVTYVVFSGQSRSASVTINRAKMQSNMKIIYDPDIIPLILRGTNDSQSALAGHSLLGDIYGRHAVEGFVRDYLAGFAGYSSTARNDWYNAPHGAVLVGAQERPAVGGTTNSEAMFMKVSLNHTGVSISGTGSTTLAIYDDAYNARIFTMLEGPLQGYSFRILKYVGDENNTIVNTPVDPLAYSILIDLNELPADAIFSGAINTGTVQTIAVGLHEWLARSPTALFYNENGQGYRYLINDAVYNGVGYGLNPEDGNLTQRIIDPDTLQQLPLAPDGTIIPVGLLPNMEYMQLRDVLGSTNEGYDVADYRDYWLSHLNPNGDGVYEPADIIPSYHRPALVNYIVSRYGGLASIGTLTPLQLREMFAFLDYACARPIPIVFGSEAAVPGRPTHASFAAGTIEPVVISNWPAEVTSVTTLLERLMGANPNGSAWDVDNDGDGVPESIWQDPQLPTITAPDGRTLKIMTAIHIEDLDSRINVNLAGDTLQAFEEYQTPLSPANTPYPSVFARTNTTAIGTGFNYYLPQGSGLGPAEIGFGHLLQNFAPPYTAIQPAQLDFVRALMRARHGDDSASTTPYQLTGVPGKLFDPMSNSGNDWVSSIFERGMTERSYFWFGNGIAPRGGYPLMTRGRAAWGIDRNGNMAMYRPMIDDPSSTVFQPDELSNDPYELSQNATPQDQPFTLAELERLLRRFDSDTSALSDRLLTILQRDANWSNMAEINRVITTRSHELRQAPIGFAGRDQDNILPDADPRVRPQVVGSMLEWIALLYEHQYRIINDAGQMESGDNDPSMRKNHVDATQLPPFNPDIIRALFPVEFRHGLRMNLNRPFGNGFDNDSTVDFDGANGNDAVSVDDPTELAISGGFNEKEPYLAYSPSPTGNYDIVAWDERVPALQRYPYSGYTAAQPNATVPPTPPRTNLQSRQLFARQLYCLAQLIVPQEYMFPTMNGLTQYSRDWYKRRARTLAQWAVNVVDFRDSDAVMTRFDYDWLPFGIRANAAGTTTQGAWNYGKDPGWSPEAGDVVWGMEYPEMLLTETLAFHDKRVRETTRNTTNMPAPSQFRIPQGSLMIELVNTRTNAPLDSQEIPAVPKELYINNAGIVSLNLAQLAPAPTAPTAPTFGVQPVWRIGVTPVQGQPGAPLTPYDQLLNTGGGGGNARTPSSISQLAQESTNQVSEVGNMQFNGLYSDLANLTTPLEFERVIWFTNQKPSQINDPLINAAEIPNLIGNSIGVAADHKVFVNKSPITAGNTALPTGSYFVIGPRERTFIGSRAAVDQNTDQPEYEPSAQEIRISANDVRAFRIDGTLVNDPLFTANRIKPTITQIAQADPPDPSWQDVSIVNAPLDLNEGIGLSVSEPLPVPGVTPGFRYYPMPDSQLSTVPGSGYETRRPDAFEDLSSGQSLSTALLDEDPTINPNLQTVFNQHQTHADFRTIYLQRLADPMQPYDPDWNPYITIDTMSVDLTLFTGENDSQAYGTVSQGTFAFESRFKDGQSMDGRRVESNNVAPTPPTVFKPAQGNVGSYFSASTAQLSPTLANGAHSGAVYFNYELGYQDPASQTTPIDYSSTTLGYLNIGHTQFGGGAFDGFGEPQAFTGPLYGFTGTPDPNFCMPTNLFWPNRQFTNASELMLVPYTAPGQLGAVFTSALGLTNPPATNVYGDSEGLIGTFGHLFNFFDSNVRSTTLPNPPVQVNDPNAAPRREPYWMRKTVGETYAVPPRASAMRADLGLLLELVETTPRYRETAEIMNPIAIDRNAQGVNANNHPSSTVIDTIRDRMLVDFHSPYNLRQSYTNPGKVNINTITDERVWNGIDFNALESTVPIGGPYSPRQTATGLPQWPEIVRHRRGYTPSGATNFDDAMPTQFAGAWKSPFASNITPPIPDAELRRFRPDTDNTVTNRRPLDVANPLFPTGSEALLKSNSPLVEQVAQPLLTYQRFGRLTNLVTNQSNVFAVWITVGLFEWDPVAGLGAEYVGTGGRPERQRSFYIIDRTVPVAFREGDSFNTEKAILLRRSIQR